MRNSSEFLICLHTPALISRFDGCTMGQTVAVQNYRSCTPKCKVLFIWWKLFWCTGSHVKLLTPGDLTVWPFWNEVGGDLSFFSEEESTLRSSSCREEEPPSSKVLWFHRGVSTVKLSRNWTVGGVEWFECWIRRWMDAKSKLYKCNLYLHPLFFLKF